MTLSRDLRTWTEGSGKGCVEEEPDSRETRKRQDSEDTPLLYDSGPQEDPLVARNPVCGVTERREQRGGDRGHEDEGVEGGGGGPRRVVHTLYDDRVRKRRRGRPGDRNEEGKDTCRRVGLLGRNRRECSVVD